MFSNNITFRNGDSHSIIDIVNEKRINYAKNIHIGNKVWIGENSYILKGAEIQNESIVATNSVVTKKFEYYCYIHKKLLKHLLLISRY